LSQSESSRCCFEETSGTFYGVENPYEKVCELGAIAFEPYDPQKGALPALKLKRSRERKAIEDDATVKSLVHSNLLLDTEFNALYLDFMEKSGELLELISRVENERVRKFMSDLPEHMGFHQPEKTPAMELLGKGCFRAAWNLQQSGQVRQISKADYTLALTKGANAELRKKLRKLSNEIQNGMSAFEQQRHVELQILSSTTLHLCRRCAYITSLVNFRQSKCVCGERISNVTKVRQLPLYHLNKKLINFVANNYWVEHGVDYVLKRKGLETRVGHHVMGHSGAWHEIDNIADSKKDKHRFFGECKHGQVKVNDIFVFAGKMADVGCTRGYVFTTSQNVSGEVVRLARSKNIDIVTGVLKRDVEDLLRDIKEG